ncbi:hypothetical protein BS78_K038800 [Paspalum vaginatum]|uniref:DUF632 domain-containing protein n=1 Tax=Paspalum vaginatum TaxID=158149 RepID=A0A9W8CG06_9POAL|nr:hypothetical protein BS78_K038800 [Paspalum vaginatum]
MAASLTPQPPQMPMPYNSTGYPLQQVPAPYVFDYPPLLYTYSSYYRYHQDQGQNDTIPSSHSRYGGYPYQYYSQSSQQGDGWPPVSASSSHQLPPPSPPMESAWGFSDPFEALEGYYQDHPTATAAQSSNDARDEDMPELEEDEDNPELEDEECISSTTISEDEEEQHIEFKESSSAATSSSNGSNMVHGNGVEEDNNNAVEEQLEDHSCVVETEPAVAVAPEKVYNNDIEVVQEIKLQFERASKSAGDVCKMLDVGKMPHSKKNSGLKVSLMMICGAPSKRKKFLKFEEEKAMECGNLSSSLQQLYWWEKKLLPLFTILIYTS